MHDTQQLLKLADSYYLDCLSSLVKVAFIKKLPNGKWRVLSQKGKSLGTYDTKDEAVTRLRQVEYFKHHDKSKADDALADDKVIDLTESDDFSYSAIMRQMRQKADKEQLKQFLQLFKNQFDRAVKNKLQKPEKIALQNALISFNKLHKIKVNRKLVKNATVAELGNPAQVGQYLANIARFILMRLDPVKRSNAIENLRKKLYFISADEIAQKVSPPTAGIGQCITFIKHTLFNQSPQYIREVLNNISRNLY